MNSKGHLGYSIAKSIVRIVGCIMSIVMWNWVVIPVFFGLAEGLGLLEEFVDER